MIKRVLTKETKPKPSVKIQFYVRLYDDYNDNYTDVAIPSKTVSITTLKEGYCTYQFYEVCIVTTAKGTTVSKPRNFTKLTTI